MILQATRRADIDKLKENKRFCELLEVQIAFQKHMLSGKTWFEEQKSDLKGVAYFSMEFGLSEALPIYSGGLGILAGDHLKSASDLGLPLFGIGLLYQVGYFRQRVDATGHQSEVFPYNEPGQIPVTLLPDVRLTIDLPGRDLHLRVFEVRVGRIKLYLLDSNDMLNYPVDRAITSELYGGDKEMRLQQEIVLGGGGYKLIDALGLEADFFHLNEGHAAFAGLARAHALQKKEGCDFHTALEKLKPRTLFTTHTPVAAGFDKFEPELIENYFSDFAAGCGLSMDEFLALGLDGEKMFNMAYLAVRLSKKTNAVSALHEQVSKELFKPLNATIGHVTNGIHVPSWESPEANQFWTESKGKSLKEVSDEKLWAFRCRARARLIDYSHARLDELLCRCSMKRVKEIFSPDILTLGFARRFATYKRADLLLRDKERLHKILSSSERPVQLIIAGKAHPADEPGKAILKEWVETIRTPRFRPHVIFLNDYDILVAERLVQGVDVWINTPRRPYEASGTSGMKVLVNGGLNLSVLDGWWAEAYRPGLGWALEGVDDEKDAFCLYELLENEVVPTFYERDEKGLPTKWLAMVRESMSHLTTQFSTGRMAGEYAKQFYK